MNMKLKEGFWSIKIEDKSRKFSPNRIEKLEKNGKILNDKKMADFRSNSEELKLFKEKKT